MPVIWDNNLIVIIRKSYFTTLYVVSLSKTALVISIFQYWSLLPMIHSNIPTNPPSTPKCSLMEKLYCPYSHYYLLMMYYFLLYYRFLLCLQKCPVWIILIGGVEAMESLNKPPNVEKNVHEK